MDRGIVVPQRQPKLVVQVRDADSGQPVDALVHYGGPVPLLTVNGHFVCPLPQPGTMVQVTAEGYAPWQQPVPPANQDVNLVAALRRIFPTPQPPAQGLTIHVFAPNGNPISADRVEVFGGGQPFPVQPRGGNVYQANVPPGQYHICASKMGVGEAERTVVVGPQGHTEQIILQPSIEQQHGMHGQPMLQGMPQPTIEQLHRMHSQPRVLPVPTPQPVQPGMPQPSMNDLHRMHSQPMPQPAPAPPPP
jgi:hypothetical protein